MKLRVFEVLGAFVIPIKKPPAMQVECTDFSDSYS